MLAAHAADHGRNLQSKAQQLHLKVACAVTKDHFLKKKIFHTVFLKRKSLEMKGPLEISFSNRMKNFIVKSSRRYFFYETSLENTNFSLFFLFDWAPPHQPSFPSSHSASPAAVPWRSEDLLITGSEVHYQCVHCQPSRLGLEEGQIDLIRRSWVLITSKAKKKKEKRKGCVSPSDARLRWGSPPWTSRGLWSSWSDIQTVFGHQNKRNKKWIMWWQINKQRHKIAAVVKHRKLLLASNGSATTFKNNKRYCCSAEAAEHGYDDIHRRCHHYGYGNFALQRRTLAGRTHSYTGMAREKA